MYSCLSKDFELDIDARPRYPYFNAIRELYHYQNPLLPEKPSFYEGSDGRVGFYDRRTRPLL